MTYTEIYDERTDGPLSHSEMAALSVLGVFQGISGFGRWWSKFDPSTRDGIFSIIVDKVESAITASQIQTTVTPHPPVTINFTPCGCSRPSDNGVTKQDLEQMEERIMATQAETAARVNQLVSVVQKIGEETTASLAKIEELKALAQNEDVSDELLAAVDALETQLRAVDDKIADTDVPTDVPADPNEPPTP